jgi:hypothetical protein
VTPDENEAVQALLRKYRTYKTLAGQERAAGSRLARVKLTGATDPSLVAQHARLRTRLQRISDAMTFANPLIWIAYKNRAYRHEAQPILTVHDLRQHCRPAGYVCTKRFSFVSERLRARGNAPLSDALAYPDDMPLTELLDRVEFVTLSHDQDFLQDWSRHEFHVVGDRVAKWESYVPSTATPGPTR